MTGSSPPTSTFGPRLPPELILLVFEHSEKPLLSVCSLVCHSWLHLARPYLFHKLDYTFPPPLLASPLDELISPHLSMSLHAFISCTPAICPYVQDLTLQRLRRCRFKTLIAVLQQLPHLRALRLSRIVFRSLDQPRKVLVDSPVIQSLRTLEIRECRYPLTTSIPARCITQLLSLFGDIENLVLMEITSGGHSEHYDISHLARLQIRSFTVENSASLRYLWTLANPEKLHAVILCSIPTDYIARLVLAFLSSIRSSLRHLGIADGRSGMHGTSHADHNFLPRLDISAFSALEHLTIALHAYDRGFEDMVGPRTTGSSYLPPDPSLLTLIPTIPASVHTVTLRLYTRGLPSYSRATAAVSLVADSQSRSDWSSLDVALTARIEKGLGKVEFDEARAIGISEQEQRFIARLMPKVFASGVARFANKS